MAVLDDTICRIRLVTLLPELTKNVDKLVIKNWFDRTCYYLLIFGGMIDFWTFIKILDFFEKHHSFINLFPSLIFAVEKIPKFACKKKLYFCSSIFYNYHVTYDTSHITRYYRYTLPHDTLPQVHAHHIRRYCRYVEGALQTRRTILESVPISRGGGGCSSHRSGNGRRQHFAKLCVTKSFFGF